MLYETLETRALMSVSLIGDTLQIRGTDLADNYSVSRSGLSLTVNENGTSHSFLNAAVARIDANLFGGNDTFKTLAPLVIGPIFTLDTAALAPVKTTGAIRAGVIDSGGLGGVILNPFRTGYVYTPMSVDAGFGNDDVTTGLGNDTVQGNGGNDTLRGGSGDDVMDGGIFGAAGYWENTGNDTLYGEYGNDTLHAADRSDCRLYGGAGNDALYGYLGYDTLSGEDGNDYLSGYTGNDTLLGGAGDDTLVGGGGTDQMFGDAGNDWLDGGVGGSAVYADNTGNDNLFGGTGNDTLHASDWGDNTLHGGDGNDALYGYNGRDNLYGDAGDDALNGGGNDDGLFGGAGVDTLTGGSGDDRFLDRTWEQKILFITIRRWQDNVTDKGSNDVRIGFQDGVQVTKTFAGQNGSYTYSGKAWSDREIEVLDDAFEVLHDATYNTKLLKRKDGSEQIFTRQGVKTASSGGTFTASAWNSGGNVSFTDYAFDTDDEARGTLLHEQGHNWDTEYNAAGWRAVSGWTQTNQSGNAAYQQGSDASGSWWYLKTAQFASSYARTNPNEDFAESFGAYYMNRGGFSTGDVNVAAKATFMNNMRVALI